ncbi:MAG: putative xylanase/chitin deacetylase [Acidobacteria bacterium OLB17]|nr:MAG: putative xylanase/chitin deacetylase [Acidobacteria bacterium OLB17]MCZ2390050.1 polysaccharide deacetylase family protein [Acidobacteriota bacterium]
MTSPFLLYHKIDRPTPDVKIRGAFTPPKAFARQLAILAKSGFSFATAGEMAAYFRQAGEFPKRTVAITFDDGWKDNLTFALPILREYNAKATIFLVTSCLGKTTDLVTADGEGPRQHLSADDVRAMTADGIEFGSHTHTHRHLHKLDPAETRDELKTSKDVIEDLTQKECVSFAYPAGFFDQAAKEEVQNAGFKIAFTTVYSHGNGPDLFELPRTEILRRDRFLFRFRRKIAGLS